MQARGFLNYRLLLAEGYLLHICQTNLNGKLRKKRGEPSKNLGGHGPSRPSRTSRSWWITHSTQRQQRGCNNIPSFLQRTTPMAQSFCEGCTWHDLDILVTSPVCCDRKARAACVQSITLWQQATIEIMRRNHSIIACSCHILVLFFTHIPFVVKHTYNATPAERLQHF